MKDIKQPVCVISQPMYFPWIGLLEQIKLSDIFVFYEDVQFVRGFFNRVQIKTSTGTRWITVPHRDYHRGQKINEVLIDDQQDWRKNHRMALNQAYRDAPFLHDMLTLVDQVFAKSFKTISELSTASTMALVDYFDLRKSKLFFSSVDLGITGVSSQRLHDITVSLGAKTYLTGHGARNYLNHKLFENSFVSVEYIDYKCVPYPQFHGSFNPYVSALDLVANCGRNGNHYFLSQSIPYKIFLNLT